MKLTVTVYENDDGNQWGNVPTTEIVFEDVQKWEVIGEFFVVVANDESQQAIRENKVVKFALTN